jgi:hypothetical protein
MKAAAKTGRRGHRDSALLFLYLSASCNLSAWLSSCGTAALRGDWVELDSGSLPISRVKKGAPSVHPIRGPEMRVLRRLKRGRQKGTGTELWTFFGVFLHTGTQSQSPFVDYLFPVGYSLSRRGTLINAEGQAYSKPAALIGAYQRLFFERTFLTVISFCHSCPKVTLVVPALRRPRDLAPRRQKRLADC